MPSGTGENYKRKYDRDIRSRYQQEGKSASYAKKGKAFSEGSFPSFHASLFESGEKQAVLPDKALVKTSTSGKTDSSLFKNLSEDDIKVKLADTAANMEQYLEPEGRDRTSLEKVKDSVTELDRSLTKMAEENGGLPGELKQLHNSIKRKAKKLEKLLSQNAPVNPEAFRSLEEAGLGIASGDASSILVSGMLECCERVLFGQDKKVEGMGSDDLENLLNETDALKSRRRSTKNQQALDLMEQESMGDIITRGNRVSQESFETETKPQVLRETGKHEEKAELFENRRGKETQEAVAEKHELLKEITRANRNNLKQKQAKDGLEAVRGIMHNGEGKQGFSPLAAMGLGANLYRGFTGMGFMMGMTSHIADKHKKGAEIRSVIERYLGLDQLYRNFMTKNSDIRNRSAFLQRYGREGNVRVMIRKEADKALGIGSSNKMNSFLMKKYAEELWRGAFLKEDGSLITEGERKKEAPEKKQKRKLYADMLRALGFYVRYPSADGEAAGFTAQAVFSRFVSYI